MFCKPHGQLQMDTDKIRSPKSEFRKKSDDRNPKSAWPKIFKSRTYSDLLGLWSAVAASRRDEWETVPIFKVGNDDLLVRAGVD